MSCSGVCRQPTRSQAHCGVCHRTLGSVSDFDRHRRGGACVDPAELGLVEVAGLWASPEGHAKRAAGGARLAENRARRVAVVCADGRENVGGPSVPSKINNADLPCDGAVAA